MRVIIQRINRCIAAARYYVAAASSVSAHHLLSPATRLTFLVKNTIKDPVLQQVKISECVGRKSRNEQKM
ncbi:hypothetical protein HAX54_027583, partial [Datura stramonium]|nr:hypothetical protein [Datura stramonium]